MHVHSRARRGTWGFLSSALRPGTPTCDLMIWSNSGPHLQPPSAAAIFLKPAQLYLLTPTLNLVQRLPEQLRTKTLYAWLKRNEMSFFGSTWSLQEHMFTFCWITQIHYAFWRAADILILSCRQPHVGNEPILCLGSWKRMWKYLVLWYFSSDSTDTVPQALWK